MGINLPRQEKKYLKSKPLITDAFELFSKVKFKGTLLSIIFTGISWMMAIKKRRVCTLMLILFFLVFDTRLATANTHSSSTNGGGLVIETEFCLVNSTMTPISIRYVGSIDKADWKGKSQPEQLFNQPIMPFAAVCWPLSLVPRLLTHYQFNIEIKTNSGAIGWTVKQYEAMGNILKEYATFKNETQYHLLQKAGDAIGYATNVFIIEETPPFQNTYLSSWMKDIPDEYTLENIQLIGAHNAGINHQDGVHCTVLPGLAVAQSASFATQLSHGVRYFDIRLEKGKDNLHYPYHKTLSLGCSSKKSFEDSLQDILNFIKKNQSETVFLKLSHTSAPVDSVIKMLNRWTELNDTASYFYKSNQDSYNWVDKKLGEVRGKIVLLLDCEYKNFLNPQKGYFSFSTAMTGTCDPDSERQVIYDKYSNTLVFNRMYYDQLNKLKQHGKNKKQLFLLSWTLTGGNILSHTPRPTANLARLSHEQFGKLIPFPNIIYYDFIDPGINTILIANYKKHYPL